MLLVIRTFRAFTTKRHNGIRHFNFSFVCNGAKIEPNLHPLLVSCCNIGLLTANNVPDETRLDLKAGAFGDSYTSITRNGGHVLYALLESFECISYIS